MFDGRLPAVRLRPATSGGLALWSRDALVAAGSRRSEYTVGVARRRTATNQRDGGVASPENLVKRAPRLPGPVPRERGSADAAGRLARVGSGCRAHAGESALG